MVYMLDTFEVRQANQTFLNARFILCWIIVYITYEINIYKHEMFLKSNSICEMCQNALGSSNV